MEKCDLGGKTVIVAVRAARNALLWSLSHVVQAGDCVKLLLVVPSQSSTKKIWRISRFTSDCASGNLKSISGISSDRKQDVADSCSQRILQLQDVYDPEKVKVRIKIVPGSPHGIVAAEAKKARSNWVILDKHFKHEKKHCLNELQCNLIVMKRRVVRLNLVGSPNIEPKVEWPSSSESETSPRYRKGMHGLFDETKGPYSTPVSSPEHESPPTATNVGMSSISSSDPEASPVFLHGLYERLKKDHSFFSEGSRNPFESDSDSNSELDPPTTVSLHLGKGLERSNDSSLTSTSSILFETSPALNRELDLGVLNHRLEAFSQSRNAPPRPPPLCSICQHKTPIFGHPPRSFTYA
ncbi:inactive protein kinase SELMODRAFT_444075-like [Hibiscus syriacus]|uniref:inactive protein kinase SELMODRAFT_444075-like n=1 Tax=Hibiscus syriacus TaxID=106335 RepID=UPI001924EEEB|nr:inactive protein kinase SELMODRAFT_444075-like [Hibiscus syriacus]